MINSVNIGRNFNKKFGNTSIIDGNHLNSKLKNCKVNCGDSVWVSDGVGLSVDSISVDISNVNDFRGVSVEEDDSNFLVDVSKEIQMLNYFDPLLLDPVMQYKSNIQPMQSNNAMVVSNLGIDSTNQF